MRKCCDECPGDDTCPDMKVCMCGDDMEKHPSAILCGHSPVSIHDYHVEESSREKKE